jgi:hypothetical protein
MKKITLLFTIALLGFTSVFSQLKTNLVFFTEQGEHFSVVLNGILQNAKPETNVKVTDLIAPSYKVKILFDDSKIGDIDKNLIFNQGTETTLVIKKNKKGNYVIRYMNEVPIAQALPPSQGQSVIVYTTVPPPPSSSVTYSQTTTTVNAGNNNLPPSSGNVSAGVNINDPDLGVNLNINVGGSNTNTISSATTTTTTTTTTTGGTQIVPVQPPQSPNVYVLSGYTGPIGCPYPMSPQEFESVRQSIYSKSFDDTKLKIAKQVISSNCLLSSQVKKIMLLFDFEDTRLNLAKYAYGYTYDIGNYYQLNDAFTFESTIDELNDYINTYH